MPTLEGTLAPDTGPAPTITQHTVVVNPDQLRDSALTAAPQQPEHRGGTTQPEGTQLPDTTDHTVVRLEVTALGNRRTIPNVLDEDDDYDADIPESLDSDKDFEDEDDEPRPPPRRSRRGAAKPSADKPELEPDPDEPPLRRGLREHPEEATKRVSAELKRMHESKAWEPQRTDQMTDEQRKRHPLVHVPKDQS